MSGKIVWILGLWACHIIQLQAADSVRLEKKGENYFIIHQVDPGETLYALSRRYGADVKQIIAINRVQDNTIEVGQFLEIPYGNVTLKGKTHTVAKGETLFSISKQYGVTVDEIKEWNNLRTSSLSVGQTLIVGDFRRQRTDEVKAPATNTLPHPANNKKGSYTYYVQTNDNLKSIADKFKVPVDSILVWNNLTSTRINIGQPLVFPFDVKRDTVSYVQEVTKANKTNYGSKRRVVEEGGVKKIYEEGIAKVVDQSIETQKYLALHRNLKVGTVLQVRNIMNNETIYVRVIGKLPDTGINENVMVRLTPIAFERLGILDEKALVEITYFEQ